MSVEADRHAGPAATVDDYLAALPGEARAALQDLRATIRAAAPEADEGISYRVPTYRYQGPLVHFAAFKNHCSLIVASAPVVERFRSELDGHEISGTTIRFSAKNPLSPDLVRRIVRARVEENEARPGRRRD